MPILFRASPTPPGYPMQLAPLFRDHAVLQRNISLPIWGTAAPKEIINAELAGQHARVIADADGQWLLRFAPFPAGGPHSLTVTGESETITIRDVLIGDVWVCSGQSNMEWKLAQTEQADDLVDTIDLSQMRLLTVSTPAQLGKQTMIDGTWECCSATTLAKFSAVGAWFGRTLIRDLSIPIGLICNAWGGTRVQAWMSREALMQDPSGLEEIRHYEGYLFARDRLGTNEFASTAEWERSLMAKDAGNRGLEEGWAQPDCDLSAWKTMPIPSHWQDHGHPGSGVFWFRRSITVPSTWAGKDLDLHIGAVDKHDDTYVNGMRVGGLSWDAGPNSWCTARHYRVAGNLVPADGKLHIAVRARSHAFHGGLNGPSIEMKVHPVGDESAAIPLAGTWHYQIEQDWGLMAAPATPHGPGNPTSPNILFDSRICPLLPYAITGAIWYQGESNASEASRYARMLPAMIGDWRRAWGQGDFPFLQVQLANFRQVETEPRRSEWAELRDAQVSTARCTPATAFAIAIDVGDALDIHPHDKRSVGERLARIALADTYGQQIVSSGPIFSQATVETGGRMRCRFVNGAGLRTRDGKAVSYLAIAGANRQFMWAHSEIDGDTLLVWHPDVLRPSAVRYAWADNPAGCNLVNAEDLPASPFRTDTWNL
jgi:sialate O-acetylesterase